MNAARIVFTGVRSAQLEEQERPRYGPNEVLIRTLHTLVSPGTELAMYEGTHAAIHDPEIAFAKYPHYPGYAAIGRIEACGESVTALRAGNLVFSTGPHATWSLLDPEKGLWLAAPEDASPYRTLMVRLVQIASTASQCFRRPPERVVVVGAGLIGILAAQVLQIQGVSQVVVQDINAARVALAQRCGVRRCVVGSGFDLEPSLRLLDSKPDAVVEATGVPGLVSASLTAVRPGGDVILLGSPRGPVALDAYKLVHRKGTALIGAHEIAVPDRAPNGQASRQSLLETGMRWLTSGQIGVEGLVTDVVRPLEMPAVYQRMSADKTNVLGVIIDWA
jgi:2-desacetyl-2-hydroxyethyl bacteriochlorophyllide A dehydrogenase